MFHYHFSKTSFGNLGDTEASIRSQISTVEQIDQIALETYCDNLRDDSTETYYFLGFLSQFS